MLFCFSACLNSSFVGNIVVMGGMSTEGVRERDQRGWLRITAVRSSVMHRLCSGYML
jgi:hypothetical protein